MSERPVTTDALETLGTLITDREKRDAIHLAVDPVIAGELLHPGEHIAIRDGKAYKTDINKGHGIVDPFLAEVVAPGQRFWFIMYPRKVRSLRHVWSHPDFPDEVTPHDQKTESKEWVTGLATRIGISYGELMEAAEDYDLNDEIFSMGDNEDYKNIAGQDWKAFWMHYKILTGRETDKVDGDFFGCAC